MSTHPLKTYVQEAIALCHELLTTINAETDAVRSKKMDSVPDLAKRKDRLTTQLQNLLLQVKEYAAHPEAKAEAAPLLHELSTAMSSYDSAARQNLLVLQAAHQATSIFLDSVRQVVAKPKPNTYGKEGAIKEKAENTSLINKSF